MGVVTQIEQRRKRAGLAPAAARSGRAPAFLSTKIGGLPRSFWVLWSGTLVNRIGYMVEPFLAYYLTGIRGFGFVALAISDNFFFRPSGVPASASLIPSIPVTST